MKRKYTFIPKRDSDGFPTVIVYEETFKEAQEAAFYAIKEIYESKYGGSKIDLERFSWDFTCELEVDNKPYLSK